MALAADFTPINGVFGNLFAVVVVYDEGGSDLVITIDNATQVTLTVGTTGSVQNLKWDALAALFNADSGASALAVMVGQSNKTGVAGPGAATGGAAGDGLSQFYSAPAPGPPPPVRPARLCTTL